MVIDDISIFLCSTDKYVIRRVFDKITFGEGTGDLILKGINPNDFRAPAQLTMSYSPMFHRIEIEPFTDGRFFTNPDALCKMAGENLFLTLLKPSETYYMLMESDIKFK